MMNQASFDWTITNNDRSINEKYTGTLTHTIRYARTYCDVYGEMSIYAVNGDLICRVTKNGGSFIQE